MYARTSAQNLHCWDRRKTRGSENVELHTIPRKSSSPRSLSASGRLKVIAWPRVNATSLKRHPCRDGWCESSILLGNFSRIRTAREYACLSTSARLMPNIRSLSYFINRQQQSCSIAEKKKRRMKGQVNTFSKPQQKPQRGQRGVWLVTVGRWGLLHIGVAIRRWFKTRPPCFSGGSCGK